MAYTRSLVADYTPYYLSGAKLTWQATPKLTSQLHLVNGWQNIRTIAALYPNGPAGRPGRTNGVLVTSLSIAF